MQVRLQEKESELQGIRETIKDIHQRIGTLRERCSGIEGDDELTYLLSREAALKEEISQVSRQWAVYTVASSLLGMAVEIFERERQPEILREAQSFFTRITGGRYTRIVKPFDGSEPYVEEANGATKKIDSFSRGLPNNSTLRCGSGISATMQPRQSRCRSSLMMSWSILIRFAGKMPARRSLISRRHARSSISPATRRRSRIWLKRRLMLW